MPVAMRKVGKKVRIIDVNTGRASLRPPGRAKSKGKAPPIDKGGFPNTPAGRARARAQVQAVNLSMRRAQGKSAPPAPKRKKKK